MEEYTEKLDEGQLMLCFSDVSYGVYFEIPVDENLTTEEKESAVYEAKENFKAQSIYDENSSDKFTENFKDEVYMNGEIKRIDYSCDREEALVDVNELAEAFTEYTVEQLTADPQNVIGKYGAYRPPYSNTSISFYDFSKPSISTLAKYGCTVDTYGDDLLHWHGIKHDMSTLIKTAKFVFTQNHNTYLNNMPTELPNNKAMFFARIHNPDGTVEPWVDIYVISTIDWMRNWCEEMELTFPLPNDVDQQPWCFSIVYNDNTGEIENIKAYIRNRF